MFIRYIVPAIPTLVAGIALLALLPRGNHAKVEEPETSSSKAAADVPAGKDGQWSAFRCRCIRITATHHPFDAWVWGRR